MRQKDIRKKSIQLEVGQCSEFVVVAFLTRAHGLRVEANTLGIHVFNFVDGTNVCSKFRLFKHRYRGGHS
jgi:hypothetical protein